jgi:excisionase family DNA binding protein
MEYWSLREVAKHTRTSVAYWRKVVSRRQIPVVKIGRLVRLSHADVETYLAARTRAALGVQENLGTAQAGKRK